MGNCQVLDILCVIAVVVVVVVGALRLGHGMGYRAGYNAGWVARSDALLEDNPHLVIKGPMPSQGVEEHLQRFGHLPNSDYCDETGTCLTHPKSPYLLKNGE